MNTETKGQAGCPLAVAIAETSCESRAFGFDAVCAQLAKDSKLRRSGPDLTIQAIVRTKLFSWIAAPLARARPLFRRYGVAAMNIDPRNRPTGEARPGIAACNSELTRLEVEHQVRSPVTIHVFDVAHAVRFCTFALAGVVGIPEANRGGIYRGRVEGVRG